MSFSETQLASAQFDQPEHTGPVRRIFICSTPRSGSNTLCRMMAAVGLGLPLEYFNWVLIPDIAARFGFDAAQVREILSWRRRRSRLGRLLGRDPVPDFIAAYAAALQRRRTLNGIFAAKMHYPHYAGSLDSDVCREFLRGAIFIRLYRENLLEQAVSAHVSSLTGIWDFDGVATTRSSSDPDFMDPVRIRRMAQNIADQDRNWRMFFIENGIRPITISFDSFIRSPDRLLTRIADTAGLSIDLAVLRDAAGERYPEFQKPSKAEIIAHYIRATSRFGDRQVRAGQGGSDAVPVPETAISVTA